MWNKIVYALIAAEILMLAKFLWEWLRRKRSSNSLLFLAMAFSANMAVLLLPYIHGAVELRNAYNWVEVILSSIGHSLRALVGEWHTDGLSDFSLIAPAYTAAFVMGAVLSVLATVNAAMQAFGVRIRNHLRLTRALKKKTCDIVLGTCDNALRYAKNGAAVLIPDPQVDKDGALRLMEQGYTVLWRGFSRELLESRTLRENVLYNIICPGTTEENLENINTFILYSKNRKVAKNIHLFVQIREDQTDTVRREIIDRSCCRESITVFCADELLSRRFAQEHPITEYLPRDFLDPQDHSVRADVTLGMVFLGFGSLNREMYRNSVLNNQLVCRQGNTYCLQPLHYHLFDTDIDRDEWIVEGLQKTMEQLARQQDRYFPLPPVPFQTATYLRKPWGAQTLRQVESIVRREKSYHYIVVDVGDTYRNIETGTRLRNLLSDVDNYHIFIRSQTSYVEDEAQITYLGDFDDIFTHDVIVNDKLSALARKINENYCIQKALKGLAKEKASGDPGRDWEKEKTRRVEQAKQEAARLWHEMDHFTRGSNLYAALNLRSKLQLLGLDYEQEASERRTATLESRYPAPGGYDYESYARPGKRNAMLAQEKNRWNAYHLMLEVLPMPVEQVSVKVMPDGKVVNCTKNSPLTRHACLTTFAGLDRLTRYLQKARTEATGEACDISVYDYYQYDDQLLLSVTELMESLGYRIVEK